VLNRWRLTFKLVASLIHVLLVMMSLVLFAGCAAHSSIEPIGQGNTGLNVSTGASFNYPTVELQHGITDWMDISAAAHLASLFNRGYGGDVQVVVFPFGTAPERSFERSDWLIRPTFGLQLGYSHDVAKDYEPTMFGYVTPTLAWPTPMGSLFMGADFGVLETPFEEGRLNLGLASAKLVDPDPMQVVGPFLGHRFKLRESLYFGAEAQAFYLSKNNLEIGWFAAFLSLEWQFDNGRDE